MLAKKRGRQCDFLFFSNILHGAAAGDDLRLLTLGFVESFRTFQLNNFVSQ